METSTVALIVAAVVVVVTVVLVVGYMATRRSRFEKQKRADQLREQELEREVEARRRQAQSGTG